MSTIRAAEWYFFYLMIIVVLSLYAGYKKVRGWF